jgi:ribosomal-protein-alanine N-acetyltransferase
MGKGEPHFVLRPAEMTDISTVAAIAEDCGLSFWSSKAYATELDNPDALFLCAEVEDVVKGFAIGRFILDAVKGDELEVYNIGVSVQLRRRGMGRALLQRFIEKARERGGSAIWLEVRESNLTAIQFYESIGFSKVYERPSFYLDPTENALVLRLELT